MKYAKFLSSALQERLTHLQASCFGTISLREELAIAQNFLAEALEKYDKARRAVEEESDGSKRLALVKVLSSCREEAMSYVEKVRDIAVAAARMESDERMISVSVVHAMLAGLCQLVDEEITLGASGRVLVDPKLVAQRIADRARTELVDIDSLAATKSAMLEDRTVLVPADDEAKAMDATVPYVEDVA